MGSATREKKFTQVPYARSILDGSVCEVRKERKVRSSSPFFCLVRPKWIEKRYSSPTLV